MIHDALEIIRKAAERKDRLLVTLDGPCASGKTTFAAALAGELNASVLHTDDFVVPHAQKTAERLAIPGGNCDWERLCREVIAPWKEEGLLQFQRYDFRHDCLVPPETLDAVSILILEGSYCNLPAIRAYADVRLFMMTPEKTRLERLRQRESPESLQRFFDRWIPLENAYFTAYDLPDAECILIE